MITKELAGFVRQEKKQGKSAEQIRASLKSEWSDEEIDLVLGKRYWRDFTGFTFCSIILSFVLVAFLASLFGKLDDLGNDWNEIANQLGAVLAIGLILSVASFYGQYLYRSTHLTRFIVGTIIVLIILTMLGMLSVVSSMHGESGGFAFIGLLMIFLPLIIMAPPAIFGYGAAEILNRGKRKMFDYFIIGCPIACVLLTMAVVSIRGW